MHMAKGNGVKKQERDRENKVLLNKMLNIMNVSYYFFLCCVEATSTRIKPYVGPFVWETDDQRVWK